MWGAARLRDPTDRDRLTAIGAHPARLDLTDPDWSELPATVDHVLHFAADITRQHQLIGPARLGWREGMEALAAARH